MDSKEYAGITVPPSYDELKHEGRPAISLLLNPSFGGGEIASDIATDQNENGPAASGVEARVRTLYRLATHELVHFYHQSEAVRSASSNRDTVYPLQSEPRVLRALLHDRLNLAVTDPANRDTHLSHARSWYDQWVSGFREEVDSIREYDVREGTAVYIERRGDYVGSKLTGEELHKAQVAGLHTKRSTSVDQESYMLGFVSGILLDELRPTWKDDFYSTGKAPAELLLEGVTPVADDTGGNVRQEIEKLIAEEDARVKPAMEEVDRVTANTSVPYLRYEGRPQVSYENSYTYKGLTVLVNTILNLRSQDGEVSVVGATTLRGADATTGYNIPLEAGKYTYEDGVLKLTGETVSGRTSARRTTEDGREVFLMTVTS
ncbi:hypothetical protein [Actinomyces bovis]|nr:hypothetical protein [Actinomyces bovis]